MEIKVPTTIAEAYEEFDKLFAEDPNAKEIFIKLEKAEDVIRFHSTSGMWLRNNWGLWHNSPLAQLLTGLGIKHPDDMSHMLLEGYWSHCHGIEYTYSPQETEA